MHFHYSTSPDLVKRFYIFLILVSNYKRKPQMYDVPTLNSHIFHFYILFKKWQFGKTRLGLIKNIYV